MVGRLAPRPAAVQCAAARPPLTSHVPARSRLGRGPGDHAQDPPAPRRRLALGGDSDAPCLRVFQMPFAELQPGPNQDDYSTSQSNPRMTSCIFMPIAFPELSSDFKITYSGMKTISRHSNASKQRYTEYIPMSYQHILKVLHFHW